MTALNSSPSPCVQPGSPYTQGFGTVPLLPDSVRLFGPLPKHAIAGIFEDTKAQHSCTA